MKKLGEEKEEENKSRQKRIKEELEKVMESIRQEHNELKEEKTNKELALKAQYENNKKLLEQEHIKQVDLLHKIENDINKKAYPNNSLVNKEKYNEDLNTLNKQLAEEELRAKEEVDKEINYYEEQVLRRLESNKRVLEEDIKAVRKVIIRNVLAKEEELEKLLKLKEELKEKYNTIKSMEAALLEQVKTENKLEDVDIKDLKNVLNQLNAMEISIKEPIKKEDNFIDCIKTIMEDIKELKLTVNKLPRATQTKHKDIEVKSELNERVEELVPLSGRIKEISLFTRGEKTYLVRKKEKLKANYKKQKQIYKNMQDNEYEYNGLSNDIAKLRYT